MTVIELLKALGVEYRTEGDHHCRPGWAQIRCPWCRSGKWHLGINLRGGYCACWKCGGHRLADTLVEATDRPLGEVLKYTKGIDKGRAVRVQRQRGKLVVPKYLEALKGPHKRYLKGRGFDPEYLETVYGVRGIGPVGRLQWRVYIPILDVDGEQVSWTTRSISDDVPLRYVSASPAEEVYPHKEVGFGHHLAGHAVVVTEGPFDAMRIGPGAVATLGTGFPRSQVERLSHFPLRGVCFDREPEAQRRARTLADQLSGLDGETYLVTLDAKDAACASETEIAALRKEFGL